MRARFGVLLVVIGIINAAFLLPPRSLQVENELDVIAVIVFGLVGISLAVAERDEPLAFEYRSQTNEGDVWLHVIASPLQGAVATWFADSTQTKRQEFELREADRRKDEFLAILAHERRNPLAPIRQAAMIASLPTSTDVQKRWSQRVIERQVQHMSLLRSPAGGRKNRQVPGVAGRLRSSPHEAGGLSAPQPAVAAEIRASGSGRRQDLVVRSAGRHAASVRCSSAGSIGFTRYASNPASRARPSSAAAP